MSLHEFGRSADVDDAAMVDDGHPVAEPFRLLHQVRRQKDRFATLADAAHEIPDRPSRLRVQPGRQFVEKDQFGIVDEREGDEETLLLAAGQRHEPGISFVAQAELLDQPIAVHVFSVERRPEADGFAQLDSFLELGLLKLYADPLLQRVHVAPGIQPENRDETTIRGAQAVDALHGRGLPGPVRPNQAEYFPQLNVEGDIVYGDGATVGLPD